MDNRMASYTNLNQRVTLDREISNPSTHLSCITTSMSSLSPLNHIAPGLHQTSLTLASPVLGYSGQNLHKDGCMLNVHDIRDYHVPYIRRRSVNVPLDIGKPQPPIN